jgi:hypothetical protein
VVYQLCRYVNMMFTKDTCMLSQVYVLYRNILDGIHEVYQRYPIIPVCILWYKSAIVKNRMVYMWHTNYAGMYTWCIPKIPVCIVRYTSCIVIYWMVYMRNTEDTQLYRFVYSDIRLVSWYTGWYTCGMPIIPVCIHYVYQIYMYV